MLFYSFLKFARAYMFILCCICDALSWMFIRYKVTTRSFKPKREGKKQKRTPNFKILSIC